MVDAVITREEVVALIDEICEVCKRRNLWIHHEDAHGGFLFERESSESWLREPIDPQWSRIPLAKDVIND